MATAIRRKERQCAKARRTQLVQQQSVLSATCEACPFLNYSGADKCLECGVGVKLYNIGRELERVSMQSKARMRQLTKERVELGELAQCWRGFKFWSKDQQARTKEIVQVECMGCNGTGYKLDAGSEKYYDCLECDTYGYTDEYQKNPLLEEYVDCLHFILSIGNDWGMTHYPIECQTLEFKEQSKYGNAQECFIEMFTQVSVLQDEVRYGDIVIAYRELLKVFGALGDALGLHEDEIEQAYYDKNKENFARQARGY